MTKILSLKCFFAALLIISTSITASAQEQKAEAEIAAIMQKLHAVGLSVAVVKKNKIIYTHAFGLKNIETNTPMSTTDMFRIASISKSFSATSIMQMIEAGKLSLDDDFSKLMGFKIRNPKFPETVITLRMVMSHTSSINDSQGYFDLNIINPDKNPDYAKCYNAYEPGKGYMYCNLNFNMVGTIVEKTSGVRFDQYVKNHIITPLGLYAGYMVDSLDKSRFATLYEYDEKTQVHKAAPEAYLQNKKSFENYVLGQSTLVFSPTGGMKISSPDLAKYMMMHMNYGKSNGIRIISKKSSKTMQTKLSDDEGYGLALWNTDVLIPGEHMVGHTGSAYGLYSAMFFEPKKKFGFVVMTNGSSAVYQEGTREILRASINALYNNLIK
jgi:CubicO group peptidase (beta-lactamase class C family)